MTAIEAIQKTSLMQLQLPIFDKCQCLLMNIYCLFRKKNSYPVQIHSSNDA